MSPLSVPTITAAEFVDSQLVVEYTLGGLDGDTLKSPKLHTCGNTGCERTSRAVIESAAMM